MLRDLLMALAGACSTVIVIALVASIWKARDEAAERRRSASGFGVETYEEHFRRTELSSNDEFD